MPGTEGGGVLITGVYGAGKSSGAAEIAYLLEGAGRRYAYLDLDFLGWAGTDHAAAYLMMLRNLAAVAANYREGGFSTFVLAYFVRDRPMLDSIRDALGVPLKVVRLTVPLGEIERRLAADVTSGRRDDLAEAAGQIAAAEGSGLEDLVLANDRPVGVIARAIMTHLDWP